MNKLNIPKVKKVYWKLLKDFGRQPMAEEIACELGMTFDDVNDVLKEIGLFRIITNKDKEDIIHLIENLTLEKTEQSQHISDDLHFEFISQCLELSKKYILEKLDGK